MALPENSTFFGGKIEFLGEAEKSCFVTVTPVMMHYYYHVCELKYSMRLRTQVPVGGVIYLIKDISAIYLVIDYKSLV